MADKSTDDIKPLASTMMKMYLTSFLMRIGQLETILLTENGRTRLNNPLHNGILLTHPSLW